MPTTIVTFAHSIGDRVNISALEKCVGIVQAMSVSPLGCDYRIAYWHQGRRYSEWLPTDEIASNQRQL